MGTEVKKCKEWLEEKYGLNICDRFGLIEKVIEYCKESEDYRIESPEEIQLNNRKESEDYRIEPPEEIQLNNCKETENYTIEPTEEIQLNNFKESEDYRKGYEYGYKTATEIIESITYLKSKKNNYGK